MNKCILILLTCAALAACHTPKSVVTESHDASAMQVQCKSDSVASVKTYVDTTTLVSGATMYTEIVFTPVDTSPNAIPPEIIIDENGGIHIQGGSIQSIRQYTNQTDRTDVGITQTDTKANVSKTDLVVVNQERKVKAKVQPAADPYRWRYIWRILATLIGVAIIVFAIIFRNRCAEWLRNFIGGIARIFK